MSLSTTTRFKDVLEKYPLWKYVYFVFIDGEQGYYQVHYDRYERTYNIHYISPYSYRAYRLFTTKKLSELIKTIEEMWRGKKATIDIYKQTNMVAPETYIEVEF